jgi:two-component system, OmpR family, sensor kinase
LSSLWLRIWLSFWAVLAATFLAALAIDYGLAVHRAHNLDRLSPAAMADSGALALAQGGDEGGRRWLLGQLTVYPELRTFVLGPDGRELTGRRPSEVAARISRATRGTTFPAVAIRKIEGRTYRFVFVRDRSLAFDLWDLLLAPWVLGSLILAISGLGAALLARAVARPVRQLERTVEGVGNGSLEIRAAAELTRRRDEIGSLARGIDQMSTRISEMVAAKDAILRDVSHELRAPLTRLRAAAELAGRQGIDAFERIDKEVDRLDVLVGQILRFSRLRAAPPFEPHPVDFSALVTESVEDLKLEARRSNMTAVATIREGLIVEGDESLLRSAVENVLRNAARFNAVGGRIEVIADREGDGLRFEVRDCGPGVSETELPRIFEPFHGEGSGAGLGLAIVRRIVDLHGGDVAAANRPGGGLLVRIDLPATIECALPTNGGLDGVE